MADVTAQVVENRNYPLTVDIIGLYSLFRHQTLQFQRCRKVLFIVSLSGLSWL